MEPLDSIISFLKQTDELTTAKLLLDTFAKYSTSSAQYDKIASLYCDIKDYNSSVKYAEKALTLSDNNEAMYACRSNLAKMHNHLNNPDKSLFYLNINANISKFDYDILLEKVFSLFLLNRKSESEAILRDILAEYETANSDITDDIISRVEFNLGTYDLYAGKFKKGLEGFLLRGKEIGIWKNVILPEPFIFWNSKYITNIDLVILAEGGIGDEIINIRFMNNLKALNINPIWLTNHKDLVEVFNRNDYKTISNLNQLDRSKTYHYTHAMSLPIFLDLDEDQVFTKPYLVNSNNINLNTKNLKIGLKWSGNPLYEQDLHRSVDLDQIINKINNTDILYYSLQRDEGREDANKYEFINQTLNLDTWEDTLNSIASLDIIITSCTSIAHASAAMGKTTFVLVPITGYYIWCSPSLPWYGANTFVFRQTEHKNWDDPLNQILNQIKLCQQLI